VAEQETRRHDFSGLVADSKGYTSMAVIDLQNVTRTYHLGDVEVHALAGVDLRVESGEFLALMGASGSGKSTMLNILGCLDRPSSGRYLLEGVDVAELSEPELGVCPRNTSFS
jgi:ABC-type lipoprotein export system ATPase subunit